MSLGSGGKGRLESTTVVFALRVLVLMMVTIHPEGPCRYVVYT